MQVKQHWDFIPLLLEWLTSKRWEMMNADKGIEGNVTSATAGIVKWCKHYGK